MFETLSSEVIQASDLPCEWVIPEPMGEAVVIDFDQVNVEFNDGMGGFHAIGKIPAVANCANVTDGWYYDTLDLPTKILLCPQTCDKIQLAPKGSTSIQFGCKPLIPQ